MDSQIYLPTDSRPYYLPHECCRGRIISVILTLGFMTNFSKHPPHIKTTRPCLVYTLVHTSLDVCRRKVPFALINMEQLNQSLSLYKARRIAVTFGHILKHALLTYSAKLDPTIPDNFDRRIELTTTAVQHKNVCASLERLASSAVMIQLNDFQMYKKLENLPNFLKNSFFSNKEVDIQFISCVKNTFRDFNTVKGFANNNNETPFIPCYYKLQFGWHIVPNARLTTSYCKKDLEKLYSTEYFPMYD